jgi:hypothetical protein
MKREGGWEAGYCLKMAWDHGDECLFAFQFFVLFFNEFPFRFVKTS